MRKGNEREARISPRQSPMPGLPGNAQRTQGAAPTLTPEQRARAIAVVEMAIEAHRRGGRKGMEALLDRLIR